MTVIVSIKINDGIVMAADSVSSFANGMTYQHANKIVNLKKGLHVGAMVTGDGGIGNESIDTLLKDLRKRFDGNDPAHPDWKLEVDNFTMEQIAIKLREFLFEEKTMQFNSDVWMQVRLCGYSAGRSLSEVWEVYLQGKTCHPPQQIQGEADFGPRWSGECEALDRLILGVGSNFIPSAIKQGLAEEQAGEARSKLIGDLYEPLVGTAMPIQDAIDLARFMVETTIGFIKYSFNRPHKTVGGPIEIAAITKHEGF